MGESRLWRIFDSETEQKNLSLFSLSGELKASTGENKAIVLTEKPPQLPRATSTIPGRPRALEKSRGRGGGRMLNQMLLSKSQIYSFSNGQAPPKMAVKTFINEINILIRFHRFFVLSCSKIYWSYQFYEYSPQSMCISSEASEVHLLTLDQ